MDCDRRNFARIAAILTVIATITTGLEPITIVIAATTVETIAKSIGFAAIFLEAF